MADQPREPWRLEYESVFNLHCELTLDSGRKIRLERLDQQMTYAGLLMGAPDAQSNRLHIEVALKDARRFCALEHTPHLIPPVLRDYFREPGDMCNRRSFSTPEWLPMVQCIGVFQSIPACKPEHDGSMLVVVWFQDEYALPILEPTLGQLRSLDWNALATDFDY